MDFSKHIIFDKKYSVHIEVLDAQHQELFSIVNHVMDLTESESADIFPVLNDLVDYLSKHFHMEAMYLKDMKYPAFDAHIREHDRFVAKVQEFMEGLKQRDRGLACQMLLFLREWIWTHITGTDQKYGEYYANLHKKG